MDLAALIEKLESSEQGSRELDALIWVAAGQRDDFLPLADGFWWEFDALDDGSVNCYACGEAGERKMTSRHKRFRADPFTTSLDAALTLVPEGWLYRVDGPRNPYAVVGRPTALGNFAAARHAAIGPTAPLALCIAGLKARAALSPDPQS